MPIDSTGKLHVARKPIEEITDPGRAAKREAENYNTLARKHNLEHPGATMPLIDTATVGAPLVAQMSPAQCAQIGGALAELIGMQLKVTTRPTPAQLDEWGKSASEVSKYLPMVPPIWVAVGGLVLATIGAFGPMVMEYRKRPADLAAVVPIAPVNGGAQ